jgi:hypothetical protein
MPVSGGTGFSLSTPACERIFSHPLRDGLLKAPYHALRALAARQRNGVRANPKRLVLPVVNPTTNAQEYWAD